MADLLIGINGEDRASPAFKAVGESTAKMGEQFKSFQRYAEDMMVKGGAALLNFAKSSVKASEEQARADRQLEAVAGNLTTAFKEQAAVIQGTLGVEDDQIQKMQAMLLRYGEAPAAIDKTIRALLDYSAVSGVDAVSAVHTLTSSVETGKTAFKELGLTYAKTGERSKDLEAVTEALRLKVGGAAENDANSLTGAAHLAERAFGELQETFGGLVTGFVQRSGAIDKVTEALRGLNTMLGGDEQVNRNAARSALLDQLKQVNDVIQKTSEAEYEADARRWAAATEGESHAQTWNDLLNRRIEIETKLKELDFEGQKTGGVLPTKSAVPQNTAKKTELEKVAKKHAEAIRKINEEMLADYEHYVIDNETKMREHIAHVQEMHTLEVQALKADQDQINAANLEAMQKANDRMFDGTAEEQLFQQQEEDWKDAGERIGGAFAAAVGDAIGTLAQGGEMDAGEMVGDILAAILGVAGAAIGSVVGGPVGTMVGGAIGGLAGSAIKGVTRRKRHDGGWVEGERYHSGAWIGTDEESAVLQAGERVLSRPEVQAMGGRSGVDAATRGGGRGGATITVNTLDGSSAREYFEKAGGRALLNAVRTGRGAPSLLFGGG